jgi:hypothetical protein
MLKRRATSSSMPGCGLRQAQAESAACGQKKNASMRPPACTAARCTVSWMASSVAVSNSPRAMPDWLVATTMR